MRTEDQIKRKIHELTLAYNDIDHQITMMEETFSGTREEQEASTEYHAMRDNIGDRIAMLEWVLNSPTGAYHE